MSVSPRGRQDREKQLDFGFRLQLLFSLLWFLGYNRIVDNFIEKEKKKL